MKNELAKRAVACKHWRWMPGMQARHPSWRGFRVSHVGLTGMRGACRYASPFGDVQQGIEALPLPTADDVLPDFSDPCTLGGLLALVREAHDEPTLHVWYSRQLGLWIVSANGQEIGVQEISEVRALIAALEAAP